MEKGGLGRASMRSTSRSHFLVLALLIVSAFLAYCYWSLSIRNGELSNSLESLRSDFSAISEKNLNVLKLNEESAKVIKEKVELVTQLEAKAGEAEQKLTAANKEVTSLKDQLQKANTAENKAKEEAESFRSSKNTMEIELQKTKTMLTELQNTKKVCNKEECREVLREVIGALTKAMGKPAINGALKQNNVDIMSIAADLLEDGQNENQPANAAALK